MKKNPYGWFFEHIQNPELSYYLEIRFLASLLNITIHNQVAFGGFVSWIWSFGKWRKEERMSKKCCAAEKLSSRSSPLCQLKKCREGDLHFLVWSQDCQLKKCRLISTCLASGHRNCLVSCCGTCLCQLWKWKLSHLLWNLTCQLPFTLAKIGYWLEFISFSVDSIWDERTPLHFGVLSWVIFKNYYLFTYMHKF